MIQKGASVTRQGHYAGPISRLVAFAADIGIAWVVLLIIVAATTAALSLVTGKTIHLKTSQLKIIAYAVIAVWYFFYFTYQWALSGKTMGMALFGIQVVTAEGAPIRPRQAVVRTITLPISILIFCLGLFGIVLRVDHRAWHDRFAGTCVVYSWDARAARLRWLARQNEAVVAIAPHER